MRTKKVAKNIVISTILTVLVALIGLVKVKYLLKYLGDEGTGIYQLFNQIFSYISLVDAGLTSSLLFSLYNPIDKNDTFKINKLLKGGRNFYNAIGFIIIVLGIIVSLKIDFFISKYTLSLNYIRVCFILFILSGAINYFVTPRKVILEAKQNLYKVHFSVFSIMIIKGILEIVLVYLNFDLMILMILSVLLSIIQNILIYWFSKRDYPELDYNVEPDNSFKKETKNLIVQKIGIIIFNNTDVLLISKFIGTSSIVIYTSYMYIINSLQNIIKKIGSSSLASVGNLLVNGKNKAKEIFDEYNSLCFYIANIVCVPLLLCISSFVSIYYGKNYTLPYFGTVGIVLVLYFKIIEIPIDIFTTALGYFDKIKKCIIFQSIVNVILSIILIFKFGITGIVIATCISYIVGEFLFYPKILNNNYFKNKKNDYYFSSLKMFFISIISYLLIYFCSLNIVLNNLFEWIIYGLICFIINFIIVSVYHILIKKISFMNRFINLVKEYKK